MSVGKEAVHYFEHLASLQRQIWPDACDVGILDEYMQVPRLVANLEELKELEGGRLDRWETGVSYTVRCGFEQEAGSTIGVEITVSRHEPRRGPKFWSIDLKRTSWPSDQRLGRRSTK